MNSMVKGYVDSEVHRLDCEVSDVVEDVVDRFDDKLKAEVESIKLSHQTFQDETERVVMELQKKVAELDARLCELE